MQSFSSLSLFITENLSCFVSFRDLCSNSIGNILDRDFLCGEILIKGYVDGFCEGILDELAVRYEQFVICLAKVQRLQAKFPELFGNLQFMCHQNNWLNEAKFGELGSRGSAKLVDFILDDDHVESLFMLSLLSTLLKFQNNLLGSVRGQEESSIGKRFLFERAKSCVESDFIGMDKFLLEKIVVANSWCNPEYNCDSETIYNYEDIENCLHQALVADRATLWLNLSFNKQAKFCYFWDFNR